MHMDATRKRWTLISSPTSRGCGGSEPGRPSRRACGFATLPTFCGRVRDGRRAPVSARLIDAWSVNESDPATARRDHSKAGLHSHSTQLRSRAHPEVGIAAAVRCDVQRGAIERERSTAIVRRAIDGRPELHRRPPRVVGARASRDPDIEVAGPIRREVHAEAIPRDRELEVDGGRVHHRSEVSRLGPVGESWALIRQRDGLRIRDAAIVHTCFAGGEADACDRQRRETVKGLRH